MSKAKMSEIYGSYKMLHPTGALMCRCNLKRANWYIERNIAKWIDDTTFQLIFEPKGQGKANVPYYTQELENKCVVCSSQENLNRHHVVPYVFRSRFPIEYKTRNHYDILPLCLECHESYETEATKLKEVFANQYGTSLNCPSMSQNKQHNKRILSARKLLSNVEMAKIKNSEEKSNIPSDRIQELEQIAKGDLLPEDEIKGAVWADIIMQNILQQDQLFDFVKSWREHFINTMKPQYMPEFWNINHPLEKANKFK